MILAAMWRFFATISTGFIGAIIIGFAADGMRPAGSNCFVKDLDSSRLLGMFCWWACWCKLCEGSYCSRNPCTKIVVKWLYWVESAGRWALLMLDQVQAGFMTILILQEMSLLSYLYLTYNYYTSARQWWVFVFIGSADTLYLEKGANP